MFIVKTLRHPHVNFLVLLVIENCVFHVDLVGDQTDNERKLGQNTYRRQFCDRHERLAEVNYMLF